ncbi:Low molecular weight protein tyrosine phosphatase [Synechococcus sp. WH 8101]|uniref:low molecular weight protein-tyrosine-phosphatase n=1 Tax=Synechococcus sp. WH 8101 TaxID=59932 RepID=UPI001022FA1E|nr:low molecular weight protein-tyrosine-phosphatase [Synechococcus sp. WH 8101]QBE68121.1 Low molecular weight protein tyrosine phosphatase [Synechococcus sp. WH 8101]
MTNAPVPPQRLLFVCLGNICRSPAAEGVFLHLVKQRDLDDHFLVDSAGTGGWHVGRPADQRMQAAAKRRGIDLPSRARQLDLGDLEQFDLILTMDADNLLAVQNLAREAGERATAQVRPMLSYARRHQLSEVPDPYYGGEDGFEDVLDLLEDACEGLLEELSPRA